MVAQEHHKDGNSPMGDGLHLHVAIWLKKKIDYVGNKYWNFVGSTAEEPRQANIKLMKYPQGWIKYITKDGGAIASTEGFDPVAFLKAKGKKQSTKAAMVATMLSKGLKRKRADKLEEVREAFPGFFFMQMKKTKEFIAYMDAVESAAFVPVPLYEVEAPADFNQHEKKIFNWLKRYSVNKVLDKESVGEDRHLRVVGPTGIGKTTLIKVIRKFFRCYIVPYEKWQDAFEEGQFDLIVLDEFGKKNILWPQMLNGLVDGMGAKLLRRNMPPVLHDERLPAIMFTNLSWERCYPNVAGKDPEYLAATTRRFENVTVGDMHGSSLQLTLFRLGDFLKSLVDGVTLTPPVVDLTRVPKEKEEEADEDSTSELEFVPVRIEDKRTAEDKARQLELLLHGDWGEEYGSSSETIYGEPSNYGRSEVYRGGTKPFRARKWN